MGRVQHGGRTKGSKKHQAKSVKTKRFSKDVDQVHEELQRQAEGLPRTRQTATTVPEADPEDLPGGGEFLCVECSRHFVSTIDLGKHQKTKIHKRRLKQLRDDPYSQAEAEQAAGLGTDNRRRDGSGGVLHPANPVAEQLEVMAQ